MTSPATGAYEHLDMQFFGLPVTRDPHMKDGTAVRWPMSKLVPGLGDRIYIAAFDPYGYPSRLPGEVWPLWTRHTLGSHEGARDRRRRRKAGR